MKTFETKLGRTFKPYLRNPPRDHGAALRTLDFIIATS